MSQKYDDLTLSTAETIERFEQNINSLAGKSTAFFLECGENLFLSTVPAADHATLIDTDGVSQSVDYGNDGFDLSDVGNINEIVLYNVTNDRIGRFSCSEGKGVLLTSDLYGECVGTLSKSSMWSSMRITNSWQEKIDVAKDDLKLMIENELTNRNYVVDELNGQKLIDIVSNPEIFQKCSDFLVLKMIYTDLCDSQMSALYKNKITLYENRLSSEFSARCRALQLDPALSGEPTENRPDFTGRLEL